LRVILGVIVLTKKANYTKTICIRSKLYLYTHTDLILKTCDEFTLRNLDTYKSIFLKLFSEHCVELHSLVTRFLLFDCVTLTVSKV